jgi:maleate isomerase
MVESLRRLGLLVPASDGVTEADFHHYLPTGVVFHTARLTQEVAAKVGSAENLTKLVASTEPTARSLTVANLELIVYACTSASFFKGFGWDRELARRIESVTGIPALTTSTAVVEALHAMGAGKVFMITPYPDAVNQAEVRFLEANGIDIADSFTFDVAMSREIVAITPERIIEGTLERRPAVQDCATLLISCTGLRAMETVEPLEAELGLPVVTSNSATIWAALHRLKVDAGGVRAGRLFGLPPSERSRVA